MILLVDTHLLVWAAGQTDKLSGHARELLAAATAERWFSAASLWEISIKYGLGRDDFRVDPNRLRRGLLANGWTELAITGEHAIAIGTLPPLHKDPIDRLLLAQALVEGATLVTSDEIVGRYPGNVRLV